MRVLVDSSTLIALARIGKLDMLRGLFEEIFITKAIKQEILMGGSPDTEVFREAFDEWIRVIDYEGKTNELKKYGLDSGEASLFLAARPDDRLVIDEANARRFAETRGLRYTGLIGLLVAAVRRKRLERKDALEMLNKLATGDFRMTPELYVWARDRIEGAD